MDRSCETCYSQKEKETGRETNKERKKMEIKMNNGRPDSKPTQIQTNHGSDRVDRGGDWWGE